ncbi:MAG: hypothetical protein QNJ72_20330 [Pleurocapsa sp. MO_226.B13]|nr:hypothetical protein [Pleurocapsa sp. MO_226.B13]
MSGSEGVAYPVVWDMLEKKGNSNGNERMDLLDCEALSVGIASTQSFPMFR